MQIEPYQPPSPAMHAWHRFLQQTGWRTIPLPELYAKYGSPQSRFLKVDGMRIHVALEEIPEQSAADALAFLSDS